MELKILQSADEVARQAALFIADLIKENVAKKGFFTLAISGGRTPWEMIKILAQENLPWEKVYLFQVDERIAPEGNPERNLTQLFTTIQGTRLMTRLNIFPMRVIAENLEEACEEYASHIQEVTRNGKLDLIHLGLGSDGHTASLVPGDAVCEVADRDVALTTSPYQGRQRMTLTYPLINRAEKILWLLTGEEKTEMLQRLLNAGQEIPAGRVSQNQALIFADEPAAKNLIQ
ncbi:6-phosphogluconolactonase [Algoriphagus lacus]|uniref:6-phosphogluconolactonase n=1 Tax=Algoriphagus lacus TaxID=2056311 RepID=A0A418PS64_9BACT|nr:6-phosphogluconolactonase [Algoriphagus lacus]RIW15711.1 6-phosphogluconolactonase [Algoriphagus lacus]